MKSLLLNEKIRKNLYKWLGMYLGVIALFSSVVTYSKYVTELSVNENARAAKFDININYDKVNNCKPGENSETCISGTYRPTSEIPYYFTVDTRNLEVRTFLVLSISVNPPFKIVELAKLRENTTDTYEKIELQNKLDKNKINLKEIIELNQGTVTKYRLKIQYNGEKILKDEETQNPIYYDEKAITSEVISSKIVTVDYSAEQIKSSDIREENK